MTEPSDEILVARVRAGDDRAFGVLVDRYQDRMLAYVRHMGFGDGEALDLLQDAFVRAFRHLERCGDPARFDGWLFRIVSNLCRTHGRKRQRRPESWAPEDMDRMSSGGPAPDEGVQRQEVRDRVGAALDTLPEDQREALVLMYLHGYAVKEIADVTEASPSAVKMRLKRGRDALKEELGAFFSEGSET